MNNQSPLVPQGIVDPKNKGRARVKIAVFFVLAVHGVGLLALLLQGCHREDSSTQASQTTNATPAFDATNLPAVAEPTTPTTPTPTPAIAESTNVSPPAAVATEYAVASGDTYGKIGTKFGVTVTALKEANPGVEPTKLRIGQKLHIPAPTKTVASGPGGTASPDTTTKEQPYTVKSGDTLIKIAGEHHTSVRAIRAANNLRTDRITVGQKLKIPAKGSTTETALLTPH